MDCEFYDPEMVLRGVVHESTCRKTVVSAQCHGTRATCTKPKKPCFRFVDNACLYVEGHQACQGDVDFCPDVRDLARPQERLGSLCRAAERMGVLKESLA